MPINLNDNNINVGAFGTTTQPDIVGQNGQLVKVNGVIPTSGTGGGDVYTNQPNTFTQVNTFNANTVLTTMDTGNINTVGDITATATIACTTLQTSGNVEATGNVECVKVEASGNVECVDVDASGSCTVDGVGIFSGVLNSDNNLQMDTGSNRSIRAVAYGPGRTIISDVDYLDFKQCSKLNEAQTATAEKTFSAGIVNKQKLKTQFPSSTTQLFETQATANNLQNLSYVDEDATSTPMIEYTGTRASDATVFNEMVVYPHTTHKSIFTVEDADVATTGSRVVIVDGTMHLRTLTGSTPKITWNDSTSDVSIPRGLDVFESSSTDYSRKIEFNTVSDTSATTTLNIVNLESSGTKPVIKINGSQLSLDDLDPNLFTTNGNITTTNGTITATNGAIVGNSLTSNSSLTLPDANGAIWFGDTAPIANIQQVSGVTNNNIVLTTKTPTDSFAVKCGVSAPVDSFRFSTDGIGTSIVSGSPVNYTNVRRITVEQPTNSSSNPGTYQVLTTSPEDQYAQGLEIANLLAQSVNLGTQVGPTTTCTIGADVNDALNVNAQLTATFDATFNGNNTLGPSSGILGSTTVRQPMVFDNATAVGLFKTGYLGGADLFTYVQNLRATPVWTGMPYVGAPTIFVNIAGRFALEYYTETWGTNTKVFWRGATELRAGGAITAGSNIGSLPVGIRPSNPDIVGAQGQALSDTCKVTFETNGNVIFNGSNNACTIINFSQIEYFIN